MINAPKGSDFSIQSILFRCVAVHSKKGSRKNMIYGTEYYDISMFAAYFRAISLGEYHQQQ